MPLEKQPKRLLPPGHVPQGGTPYKVKTNDDLGSIAKANGITVEDLSIYNFHTINCAEINWYLRHHVGCIKATNDRNNWVFTSNADPGVIYLPPKTGWKHPAFPSTTPGQLSTLPTPARSRRRSGMWFGIGVQEGGTLFAVGKEAVVGRLYSIECYDNNMWINIDSWRLGAGLGASIGAVAIVATGVDSPNDLNDFPVGGGDFQATLGERWGDIAKFAKGLSAVQKVASGAKFIDKGISFAEWEKTRDLIWNMYKGTDIDSHKLGLNVMGIPLFGAGLELGIYYGFGYVRVQSYSMKVP